MRLLTWLVLVHASDTTAWAGPTAREEEASRPLPLLVETPLREDSPDKTRLLVRLHAERPTPDTRGAPLQKRAIEPDDASSQTSSARAPSTQPANTPSRGPFSVMYIARALDVRGLVTRPLGPIVAPTTPVLSTSTSAYAHRTSSRVAVVLQLASAGGHPPWTPREATLVTATGRHVRKLLVWQSRPLEDKDTDVTLVLETEAKPIELRGHYLLELREDPTSPPLHLGPVSFPKL